MKTKRIHQIVNKINKLSFISLLLLVLSLYSCDSSKVYDEYVNIPEEGWMVEDTIKFDIEVPKGEQQLYNYVLGLRNNNEYLYANIFFYVTIVNPAGEQSTDTLQYLLAEPTGKWLGTGLGEIKHNLLVYKEEQKLAAGMYSVYVVHGMRDKNILGIEDVGFRLERSN